MFMTHAWPNLSRWCAGVMIVCFSSLFVGCVAQQADVVRIKRELDAKIHQLDKSKNSLQQAVADANTALEKANVLIAGQREEIKELLHARAEVVDQVATLKDTDLSQIRGAIEQNQHLVKELAKKMVLLDTKVETVDTTVQQSNETMQPLVKDLRTQLRAEEQLRTEQGGKLGEFRTSLIDYQRVLTEIRDNFARQDQQVVVLHQQVDRLGQQQDTRYQQVQTDVKDVRRHIQSVIGTLDQISTTFSSRLDAYDQQRSQASQHTSLGGELPPHASSAPVLSFQSKDPIQPSIRAKTYSSSSRRPDVSPGVDRSSNAVASASLTQSRFTTSPYAQPSAPVRELTRDAQAAYQRAFHLLRAKNYGGAAKGFSGFLRTFPDSPLAANSQYWLGECYYGQRRFQEAIGEFERVFALYPSSNKVPASLLKIGYSHLEQRHPSMARSVFQQLVRTYPQSPAAIKAHGRLQEVNATLHNPS